MVRVKGTPLRRRPATPPQTVGPRRVAFTTLSTDAPKQKKGRVSNKTSYTYEPPKKKFSTLDSEGTWMNMMSSLRKQYNIPRKVKKVKKKKPAKTTARVKKPRRSLNDVHITLEAVIKAFPARDKLLKVYPNRSSLCSLVCGMKESKKKLATFLYR